MFVQNEDMLEMYAEFRDYPFNLIDEISEAIGDDWEYKIPGDLGGTVEYVLHTYLSLREKDVILLRFKHEKTLVEIAEILGISKERVRQIQTSALKRLCNPQCLNYLQNGIYKATQDEVNNAIEQHRSAELESAVAYLRELCITKTNPTAEAPEIMTKDTDIEELDLSVRCFNCVKRAKINKIGDLEKLTFRELRRIRNLGKQAYDDLISKLAANGFVFQEETDPDERIVLKKLPVIIG